MEFEKANNILALIANLGVIVGIIFVVVEISQNTEQLAAQDRYNRLEVVRAATAFRLEDADLGKALRTPAEDRTTSDRGTINAYYDFLTLGLEWTFKELPEDELPLERWKSRLSNNDDFILYWERNRSTFDASFVDYIDQNVL